MERSVQSSQVSSPPQPHHSLLAQTRLLPHLHLPGVRLLHRGETQADQHQSLLPLGQGLCGQKEEQQSEVKLVSEASVYYCTRHLGHKQQNKNIQTRDRLT